MKESQGGYNIPPIFIYSFFSLRGGSDASFNFSSTPPPLILLKEGYVHPNLKSNSSGGGEIHPKLCHVHALSKLNEISGILNFSW